MLYVSGVDSRYDGLPFEVLLALPYLVIIGALALPYLVIIGALALSGRNVAYLKPYRRT